MYQGCDCAAFFVRAAHGYKGREVFGADPIVKKETRFIALWVVILSAAMQAVFLVCGRWDYTVLLGNLLSGTAAVLDFWLMGVTVVRTLEKEKDDEDGKEARQYAKVSQTMRRFMIIIVAVIGCAAPCFNIISVIVPLLFPKLAAWIRMLFVKGSDAPADNAPGAEETERGENDNG